MTDEENVTKDALDTLGKMGYDINIETHKSVFCGKGVAWMKSQSIRWVDL